MSNSEQRSTISLEIPVYYTPKGKPTCSRDVKEGKFCIFLETRHFGQRMHCGFTGRENPLYPYQLVDDEGGHLGYPKPHYCCPLHESPIAKRS